MQLTEAALPGAVSSLHVLSCLLGANRASTVTRQWHEPRCLPRVSDVAVTVGLRAWERSAGVEQAFWRGMLCSKGASGKEIVVIYCLPVKVLLSVCLWGGEVGCPGKVLQV